jgi:cytochrome c oxidase subunit 2
MNRIRNRRLRIVLCLLFGACCIASRAPGAASSQPIVIRIIAKRYVFIPNVVTVTQGDQVRLIATALDRTHGIKITGYGINRKLKKGVPITIEFTANKSGAFPFHCSEWCGFGHGQMKGKLVVKPAK